MKREIINLIYHPNVLTSYRLKKCAFTLSEVLITLGIIGVVAAITMPAIVANVQNVILKNQFKKAYNTFYNGVMQAQTNLGYPVGCSYWLSGSLCKEVCKEWDPVVEGVCSGGFECEDGSPLPADQNGLRGDCAKFDEELFNNVFKTVKFCEKDALANGCITDNYRGTDKVWSDNNPDSDKEANPNMGFSESGIKNRYSSWILSDGIVVIKYGEYKNSIPIYTVDINGHRGPNKWGYDLFTFELQGDYDGIRKIIGISYATETGGKNTADMIKEMGK